ncbi:hypothetical protein NPIL_540081 [Nephila pilipes]|uniref:Uncharacterized protein n=1 Tax=Nephila pilipes TaxID=299642 RepID=A0A8X6PUL0_NEPPI|nr:hypothetical protein NPIL_540081 [Nephila pilipes]
MEFVRALKNVTFTLLIIIVCTDGLQMCKQELKDCEGESCVKLGHAIVGNSESTLRYGVSPKIVTNPIDGHLESLAFTVKEDQP